MKKHAKTRLEEGQDIQSTSWLPELAEHHVYDVESFTNLFSDLKVKEKKKKGQWMDSTKRKKLKNNFEPVNTFFR